MTIPSPHQILLETWNKPYPEKKSRLIPNPAYRWWKPWEKKEIEEWYETGRIVTIRQVMLEALTRTNPLFDYLEKKRKVQEEFGD